jgi:hypothetical protein
MEEVSDKTIEAFVKKVKDMAFENIEFESEKYTYSVAVPTDPPFTTAVTVSKTNKGVNPEALEQVLLLSTDVEKVLRIFSMLRSNNEQVIRALEYCLKDEDEVAKVLCYDPFSNCPYVEVTHKDWINEKN